MWVQSTFFGSGGSVSLRSLAAYRQAHWLGHSNGAAGGVQSTRLLGGSTALTLVCRLPASSLAGTFKRCRRRGAKHPTLGRLNCASLVCRLPASSLAGTFKRCRRRGAKHLFWIGRLSFAFAHLPPGAAVSRRRFAFLQGDDEGAD